MAVGHRSSDVEAYFDPEWKGHPIRYIAHEPGTEDRGALLSLRKILPKGPFIVIHGNILFDAAILPQMIEVHKKDKPVTTIAVATKVEESLHGIVKVTPNTSKVAEIRIPYSGERIFTFLNQYPYQQTPHMIWLYADHASKHGEVSAVRYQDDWLHFQTPHDLDRSTV